MPTNKRESIPPMKYEKIALTRRGEWQPQPRFCISRAASCRSDDVGIHPASSRRRHICWALVFSLELKQSDAGAETAFDWRRPPSSPIWRRYYELHGVIDANDGSLASNDWNKRRENALPFIMIKWRISDGIGSLERLRSLLIFSLNIAEPDQYLYSSMSR